MIEILYRTSTQVGNLQRELKQCKSQMAEQHKSLVEYSSRMDEYDKKNEEANRKFSTLLQVSIFGDLSVYVFSFIINISNVDFK